MRAQDGPFLPLVSLDLQDVFDDFDVCRNPNMSTGWEVSSPRHRSNSSSNLSCTLRSFASLS